MQHMLGEPCEIAVRYINVVRSVRPFRERERERGRRSSARSRGRKGGRKERFPKVEIVSEILPVFHAVENAVLTPRRSSRSSAG